MIQACASPCLLTAGRCWVGGKAWRTLRAQQTCLSTESACGGRWSLPNRSLCKAAFCGCVSNGGSASPSPTRSLAHLRWAGLAPGEGDRRVRTGMESAAAALPASAPTSAPLVSSRSLSSPGSPPVASLSVLLCRFRQTRSERPLVGSAAGPANQGEPRPPPPQVPDSGGSRGTQEAEEAG